MSAEQIGAIFAGLVALISGIGTYAATRNKRLVKSERDLRRDNKILRGQFESAIAYIYRLRKQLLSVGRKPVEAPKVLELEGEGGDAL